MTVAQILAWTVPPSLAILGAAWALAWSRSFEDNATTVKKGS
jgi:hypothetical protein